MDARISILFENTIMAFCKKVSNNRYFIFSLHTYTETYTISIGVDDWYQVNIIYCNSSSSSSRSDISDSK